MEIAEGRGDRSFNGEVPGWVLQPGVEFAVELDPDGVVPTLPGSDRRIPVEGLLPLDVREVPPLDLKIVPVLRGADDLAVLRWVRRNHPRRPEHDVSSAPSCRSESWS